MQQIFNKLTAGEREALFEWMRQFQINNMLSAEDTRQVLTDSSGKDYDLGGQSHRINILGDGTPCTSTRQDIISLHCGHVVTRPEQIQGVTRDGEIICHRHKMVNCRECKSLWWDIDESADGNDHLCPTCSSQNALAGCLFLFFVAAFIIILIWRLW